MTYNFGSISAYSDFSDADITGLIDHAHSLGKKVIAVGFTEGAYMIASKADGFVTCAEIDPCIPGYLNEELSTSETAGEEGSSSCTQTVKERADCLITRAKYNRGGLSSLIAVITEIRSVYRNISDYLRYTVCVQIVRLILVGLPMLLGDALLDARHVMLGAFVFDLFVFFAFMLRKNSFVDRRYKNYCEVNRIRDYLKGDKSAVLSSLIASLSAIILPLIADFVFGGYDYKLEGLFVSFVLLHLISFAFVYYFNNLKELKNLRKNILFMVEIAFGLILLGICFTVPQIGVLFGVEGMMPIAYMIISFMSPAIFAVIFLLLDRRKQMKKF